MAVAMPAYAQSQDSNQPDAENEEAVANDGKAIIVAGSRISQPTLSSKVPLTSVTVEELTNTGDVSLGDALNELPSLRSTFSQGNSTRFIGTAGLNILDLRGLGTARTLVLVNGKRHITASRGDYLVDVNTIPVDLLQRVDVVTGGNSAIYGSDAVAGVVNFVMKRDFDGIALRAQDGISSRADRGSYFASATVGRNFADGRGNIAASAEYSRAQPLYFRDRDYLTGAYSGRCQYQLTENTVGEPAAGNGVSDTTALCGIKNASISDGGTLGALDPSSSAARRYLRFGTGGNTFIDTTDRGFSAAGSGNQQGGEGSTLRNTGQLAAGLQRYAFNLLAHIDVSDAFRPFVEAKYVHVDALQEGQPSFWQGSIPGFFGGGANLRCDNPFLTPQAFSSMAANGICNATPDARAFGMSRFNTDFGGRGEVHDRDTYRIVGGVEGTFNDDWKYEVSLNYGKLKTNLNSLNNLLLFDINGNDDGFLLALDATRNAAGQIVCRVNAVTVTRPDCVPINVFGNGSPSQAALDFVNTTANRKESASEFVALASVSGDLSQLFELPGGPIGFAVGAEYREEKAYSAFDALTASGGTFLNAIQPFAPGKFSVKEAFGEINIPLLADMPFVEELSVNASGRVSDYNTSAGTVWAYNVQGLYAPITSVRFRAAYARSVRTPTQSDLFSPQSQNFAQIADPCDSANINGGQNRAANCSAAGVPTTVNAATQTACAGTAFNGAIGTPWLNCTARTSSTSFLQGGNPTLQNEFGKSLILGVIFEPSFLPGFNFTVDYYNIKVEKLIATLGAQTIINLCYDNPNGINNQFCATVNRQAGNGLFDPNLGAVVSGGVNFAAQKTEGIDFDLSYRKTFDNGHKFSFRGIATYLLKLDNFTDPNNALNPNRQKSELGDPEWAANASINYDFGSFDLNWTVRYIGKQTIGTYETQNSFQGACPSSGNISGGGTCTPGAIVTLPPTNADAFPKIWHPSAFYHNMRVNIDVNNDFQFYAGMDNVFDKKPPFGQLGTAGGDPYDTFGRFLYAGVKANF